MTKLVMGGLIMRFEKLFETVWNEKFGDFKKCEEDWIEITSEDAKKWTESAYELSKLTEEEPREFLRWDNAIKLLEEGKAIRLPFFFIREKNDNPKCPRCGCSYKNGFGALSRRDNKTEICSDCGTLEAFEDIGSVRW